MEQPICQWRGASGTEYRLSSTLLLLAMVMLPSAIGLAGFLENLALLSVLVGSLLLRELARSVIANIQGLRVHVVTIGAAGGRSEHDAATPSQAEFLALMGPITHFGIWAAASLAAVALPEGAVLRSAEQIALVNLFLGLLSIMPVRGLDGGRSLALLLGRILPARAVRRISGALGLALSVIWLPAMLLCFLLTGLVLFAIPSIPEHWRMLRGLPAEG